MLLHSLVSGLEAMSDLLLHPTSVALMSSMVMFVSIKPIFITPTSLIVSVAPLAIRLLFAR